MEPQIRCWVQPSREPSDNQGCAEDVAGDPQLASSFDLVTVRSFGPLAVVAECAVRFLMIGGVLVVSEQPDDDDQSRLNQRALTKPGLNDNG
jgi:16S rRNA G527 N7-methylase RsmG